MQTEEQQRDAREKNSKTDVFAYVLPYTWDLAFKI